MWRVGLWTSAHLATWPMHWHANGWLDRVDAVLTGYLPSAAHVAFAAGLIERLRASSPAPRIIVDPILGDAPKGLYIAEEAARATRERLLPLADVLTPNAFELSWLAARPVETLEAAREAAEVLHRAAPRAEDPRDIAPHRGRPDRHPRRCAGGQRRSTGRRLIAGDTSVPHGVGDAFSALIAGGAPVGTALGQLRALIACSVGAPHLRIAESAGTWTRAAPIDADPSGPLTGGPRNALRWVMGFDFILMLTENDRTIPDARAPARRGAGGRRAAYRLQGRGPALAGPACSGRRDPGSRRALVPRGREPRRGKRNGLGPGCGRSRCRPSFWGGTRAAEVTEVTRHHPRSDTIRSRAGSPAIPAFWKAPNATSSPRQGHWRHWNTCTGSTCWPTGIPATSPRLMAAVSAEVAKPVIVAGSIDSAERVETAAAAGAQGFTVGTAALAGAIPGRDRRLRGPGPRHPCHNGARAGAVHRAAAHRAGGP